MKKTIFLILWHVLSAHAIFAFDRQDTLRGSNGRGRSWWDVQHYRLNVSLDTSTKTIAGYTSILAKITDMPIDSLQIDLKGGMVLEEATVGDDFDSISIVKEGNVWWLLYPFSKLKVGDDLFIILTFSGKPTIAKRPPWDGGFIWTKDSTGQPWISVACQGLGASSWWPCKDYQGDEPDKGISTDIRLEDLQNKRSDKFHVISNGRQDTVEVNLPNGGYETYQLHHEVSNPINAYNITFYIGDYISWTDTLMGEKGILDLSFYALRYNEARARKQFAVTKDMLRCFEHWMGPYPFYEDGYKLVEAPYLGMEHQSAVAYGNKYQMGYLGIDRSKTGVGLLFDFIIIHESGHEWFGNNITAQDVADNWLHEGFTTYTEALFAECAFGKDKAFEYTRGQWAGIANDTPVIGPYGVHKEGSGDIYDKGSAVVHMIRRIMNNDEQFRQLLRGLNKDFYHKIVTSAQVEEYISRFARYDFTPLFNQYLRTTKVPRLEWYVKDKKLYYRFTDVVDGFTLPIELISGKTRAVIQPSAQWQHIKWKKGFAVEFDKNFLIKIE
jgi:aminopeptidase N